MELFSKRFSPQPGLQFDELPDKLRRQILIILEKQVWDKDYYASQIYDLLRREHAWDAMPSEPGLAYKFLIEKIRDDNDLPIVLDIIQMLFHAVLHNPLTIQQVKLLYVTDLNRFFLENGVGYQFDVPRAEIIPVPNALLHAEAVQPALQLLADSRFVSANREFMAAFESFKRRDYGSCLTDCCCALESTLKVILTEKKWVFDPHATAKPLLEIFIKNTALPPFWEQPILVLATLRNRYDAHGGGTKPHEVPQYLARYAIHATGAAILLLADAAK